MKAKILTGSWRGAAAMTTAWLAIAGCDPAMGDPTGSAPFDAGPGGNGSRVGQDAWYSSAACAEARPLALEGQPCCPALGADACGAGLFCAAFDGRTIPTCYRERSRRSGERCGDDRHCEHGSCNLDVGRCRAGEEEVCEREVGCAPNMSGVRQVCLDYGDGRGRCVANRGTSSEWCTLDEHCLDGTCTMVTGRCGSGTTGDGCDDDEDCVGIPCIDHRCQGGRAGDLCRSDEHCREGRCIEGRCSTGETGHGCTRHEDCRSYCNLETRTCGAPCYEWSDCGEGRICSVERRCVVPGSGEFLDRCTRDEDCLSGGCTVSYPSLTTRACASVGGPGAPCDAAHGCTSPAFCSGNRCVLPERYICGISTDRFEYVVNACAFGLRCNPEFLSDRRCSNDLSRICRNHAECGEGRCGFVYACS